MQRYFSNNFSHNKFLLSTDDSYHIKSVMRMKINDLIEVVNDSSLYICSIDNLDDNVSCSIVEKISTDSEISKKIFIAQSLVKEQKMDYILQKCTELGVSGFIPYQATRSIVKLNKGDKKIDRWGKIVKEASEQSKRVVIPTISDVMDISDLINASGFDHKFLCTVNETSQNIKNVLSNYSESDTMLFVIGPEGGFDPVEEKKMIDNGFISVSLGKSVLRTETASLFIMSVLRYIDME